MELRVISGKGKFFEIRSVCLHGENAASLEISDRGLVGKTIGGFSGFLNCVTRLAALCKKVIIRFAIYEVE